MLNSKHKVNRRSRLVPAAALAKGSARSLSENLRIGRRRLRDRQFRIARVAMSDVAECRWLLGMSWFTKATNVIHQQFDFSGLKFLSKRGHSRVAMTHDPNQASGAGEV